MIIRIKDIYKTFNSEMKRQAKEALAGVSFNVRKNEIFGYLGPNGAGKTTTLKIIMGLLKPDSGTVTIMDSSIKDPDIRAKIGFLPENPSFYPFMTAYETLHAVCDLYGMSKDKHDDRIKTFLSLVGLDQSADKRVGSFSKGMTQRLGIAQAIINDPEIVILDEPLSGLDPIGRKEIKDIILMMKRRGKTVLFSSHILPDIEMTADRVCVINKGNIVGTGYVHEIIKRKHAEIDLEVELSGSLPDDMKDSVKHYAERDNKIFITVESEESADKIREYVKDRDGRIISFIPRETKLEDYFMDLLKNGEEDE